jgi:hypothetical protein
MSQTIEQLTNKFLEATVYKNGTDEEAVYEIFKEVNDRGLRSEFEDSVYAGLDPSDHAEFLWKGRRYVVPLIVKDEFSGCEFDKAMNRLDGLPDEKVGVLEEVSGFIRGVMVFLAFGREGRLGRTELDVMSARVEQSVLSAGGL